MRELAWPSVGPEVCLARLLASTSVLGRQLPVWERLSSDALGATLGVALAAAPHR